MRPCYMYEEGLVECSGQGEVGNNVYIFVIIKKM